VNRSMRDGGLWRGAGGRPGRRRPVPPGGHLAAAGALALVIGASACGRAARPSPATAGGGGSRVADAQVVERAPMHVRVRLSSQLQRLVGSTQLTLALPPGSTVNGLLNYLGDAYPAIAAMGPSMLIAVGDAAQPPATVLADGDTVDLISQMAGG
jgi:molybdopterin converting factor small subunit